ncbi:pantoate--beta-alanine ligase [Jatrophihabitans endophyticus]|uniref:pantoate--beta-alanine ligase n=1 Tax=Jatrophihabitans endophyticus TaxID=1206085 RepID=UPI0019E52837|nr:pantoate--beta-alanine ligase [Jatrophihabitans endophyticus]MBE7187036.1 pantoate--beta-alanine ligase [Jatrophihabitans endophyticus]
MRLVRTRAEFEAARAGLIGPVGLVPTMGALHAGHAALLRAARDGCASVVTTNFVNPLQFGPGEDLARYPRTLDADLAVCEREGVDLVWAPDVDDVYPHGGSQTTVQPGPLGGELEGAVRPGHFAGVLTVVAKFFGLVRPDRAFFGEKDYQQLTLVRRMAHDLELRVDVLGVPTVRESDGLALSSRNVYLTPDDRARALALSRALRAGAAAADQGADAVLAVAAAVLGAEAGVEVDYLALRGDALDEPPASGAARLLVAARVGATRLIDNVAVQL